MARTLADKVTIITGASRGLGEAMAVGYATHGATVVLAARTRADLDRVADRCGRAGAAATLVVPTDITDPQASTALVDRTLDAFGRLDVFVANAGVAVPGLTDERPTGLSDYSYELAAELLRVNTLGTFLGLKTALGAMHTGGSFIAIGSELGRMAAPRLGMYAVAKGAIDVLVRIAAAEAEPRGIRVNELSPGGMVDTHLFGPDKMPEHLKAHVPWSEPEVIVPAAVWLAGDDSLGVTGAHVVAKEFNARGAAATRATLLDPG